jgi:hypothetical protein
MTFSYTRLRGPFLKDMLWTGISVEWQYRFFFDYTDRKIQSKSKTQFNQNLPLDSLPGNFKFEFFSLILPRSAKD